MAIWDDLGSSILSVGSTRRLIRRFRRLAGIEPTTKLKLGPATDPDSSTQFSQSPTSVVAELRRSGAEKIFVYGDRAFRDEFAAAAPDLACDWVSSAFDDLAEGAALVDSADLAASDAVVTGGAEVATQFRYTLRRLHREAPTVPVLWVSDRFEFCRGTMAVPVEIEDLHALVFNHFEQFFGVKDPLLFKLELLAGKDVLTRFRILGPNESLVARLGEMAPERSGPVCLAITVAHPSLTRGRHYRYRACADAFWKGSITTIHGGHKFFANPNKPKEHRLAETTIRSGRLIVTVPNYDLDMGRDASVHCMVGGRSQQFERDRQAPVEEYVFEKPTDRCDERRFFGLAYRGYGTSFWYGLEEDVPGPRGPIASLSANHLGTVDVEERRDAALSAAEAERLAQIEAAGFRPYPHAIPVLNGRDRLAFGFTFDSCNPQFSDLDIDFFDGAGGHLGATSTQVAAGVTFIDEIAAAWDHPRRGETALALVTPAWSRLGYAPQRTLFKDTHLVLRNLDTHDQDMTESQPAWRNLGVVIPDFPHWLHPTMAVVGRTNLVGRARCDAGMRTAVVVVNGSGNLRYGTTAAVEVVVFNLDGGRASATLALPPFTQRVEWLDALLPDLALHVGPGGIAALQVRCADADINAQILTLTPQGSVALQHLWGY